MSASAQPVLHMQLGPFDRIRMRGIDYMGASPTVHGYALRRAESPELCETFTHEVLDALSREPSWGYDEDWYHPDYAIARQSSPCTSMDDVSGPRRALVLWKWEFCIRFLRLVDAGLADFSVEGMRRGILEVYVGLIGLDLEVAKTSRTRASEEARAEAGRRKSGRRTKTTRRRVTVSPNSSGPAVRKPRAGDPLDNGRVPPSQRTLFRWLARLTQRGFVPWSLNPDYDNCGCRAPQIVGKAYELLREFGRRYATKKRPTVKNLHEDLTRAVARHNAAVPAEERIVCPSRTALADFIDSLPAFLVYAGRHSLQKAKLRFGQVTTGPDVTRPFQRIEIDHWTVNLRLFVEPMGFWDKLSPKTQSELGRVHLCAAMDHRTKTFVGMKISLVPSSADTLAVLRMMCNDKTDYVRAAGAKTPWDMRGSPRTVAVDAGGPLIAEDVRIAVASLRGRIEVAEGGLPNLRGTLERSFRTVDLKLVRRFAGYTFENILARNGHKPDEWAVHGTEEIAWAVCRWVIDAYHNTPHAGLGGETPRNAWLQLTSLMKVTPPPDAEKQRHIFGVSLTRTLTNRGITVLGLHYWSSALGELFRDRGGIEVEIKLAPWDLGRISVRIGEAWHTVQCVRDGFYNVSVEAWVRTATELRLVYADQAKLTEAIVHEALDAIEAMSRAAEARAGIAFVTPTAEEIERVEREMLYGFSLPDIETGLRTEIPDAAEDLLGGGIQTGSPDEPPPAAPAPSSPGKFSFKR